MCRDCGCGNSGGFKICLTILIIVNFIILILLIVTGALTIQTKGDRDEVPKLFDDQLLDGEDLTTYGVLLFLTAVIAFIVFTFWCCACIDSGKTRDTWATRDLRRMLIKDAPVAQAVEVTKMDHEQNEAPPDDTTIEPTDHTSSPSAGSSSDQINAPTPEGAAEDSKPKSP